MSSAIRAFASGMLPSPARWWARAGATIQASAAIGRAAAAQIAKIVRRRYCGISIAALAV